MNAQPRDVIVVGGGLAGLAAAHQLAARGRDVLLFERDEQLGGRARTVREDGVPVELGAQFISDFYRDTLGLITELKLDGELVTRQQTATIVDNRKLEPIWPAQDLVKGAALDSVSKVRLLALAAALAFHWRHLDIADLQKSVGLDGRSAQSMAVNLLGQRGNDRFFEPLLRGLLYWDADTTSEAVVLSILKAFIGSKTTFHLRTGLDQLAVALSSRVDTRLGAAVTAVKRKDNLYVVETANGEEDVARAVITATTADLAGNLLNEVDARAAEFLSSVRYSRTAIVVYDVSTDTRDVPSSVVLFPPSVFELSSVNPIYDPRSLPHAGDLGARQQDGVHQAEPAQLLKVCLSSAGHDRTAALTEHELSMFVQNEVERLMPARWIGTARLVRVQRWPQALPEFRPGYVRNLSTVRPTVATIRGLACAGDYLGGPYIDGAIRSGNQSAVVIDEFLGRS